MTIEEVEIPDSGDFDTVEVIEVLVETGATVAVDQALLTLESDKAMLEVLSTAAGIVVQLPVAEGANVAAGDVIAILDVAATDEAAPAKQTPMPAPEKPENKPVPHTDAKPFVSADEHAGRGATGLAQSVSARIENSAANVYASPGVRKFARELGVDLGRVQGGGCNERITIADVQSHVKNTLGALLSGQCVAGGDFPQQPDIDFSQFGEVEIVALERIRKISARAVHRNWLLIPHVTQFDDADITDLETFRRANKAPAAADGVRLTPLAFLLKVAASALQAFPDLNSSLTADCAHLVRKKYCHIAVAVDTPGGLLMPVIRDVDSKSIHDIARNLDDVSRRARSGQVRAQDMQGACFSISSLGGTGGTGFTPIVNSPEVAILGVARHAWQPVWDGAVFEPRLLLPLALSYDHRVLDGAKAADIMQFMRRSLGDVRTLLL